VGGHPVRWRTTAQPTNWCVPAAMRRWRVLPSFCYRARASVRLIAGPPPERRPVLCLFPIFRLPKIDPFSIQDEGARLGCRSRSHQDRGGPACRSQCTAPSVLERQLRLREQLQQAGLLLPAVTPTDDCATPNGGCKTQGITALQRRIARQFGLHRNRLSGKKRSRNGKNDHQWHFLGKIIHEMTAKCRAPAV